MAKTREVTFYSDGLKLAATLYLPDDRAGAGPRPIAVLCHGLRADRKGFCRPLPRSLCAPVMWR